MLDATSDISVPVRRVRLANMLLAGAAAAAKTQLTQTNRIILALVIRLDGYPSAAIPPYNHKNHPFFLIC